ncbi:MAG: glycosyltransferase [Isosphaeraceae bacterium]|nr:glycosyltransferase [Isosphaeraceae bacterium]
MVSTRAAASPMDSKSALRKAPIHVVHLIETLGPGGAERLLCTNLKNLDPDQFRHTVVTVFSRDAHWLETIRQRGVDVVDLGCRRYLDIGPGTLKFWSFLRRVRPDLVHTHLWAADVVGRIAGRLAGVPVLSSVHNMEYEPEARVNESRSLRLKRNAALLVDRWTARIGARRLIAVSDYVGRSAARQLRFPAQRIDLVYNPIDFDDVSSEAHSDRSRVRDELGLPPDSLILLNVGRVSAQKGLLFAIRALPAIVARFPTVHLVSAGSLTDENCVRALAAEAEKLGIPERFHTLGPRRDVSRLLQACDLFVFPSLYEGMGIALIEAMASGRACIASDVGPLPELIRHGEDGWLVSPRSSEEIAEAVCRLLGDPAWCGSLAAAAAASMSGRFRPVESAERLAAIYQSVLG